MMAWICRLHVIDCHGPSSEAILTEPSPLPEFDFQDTPRQRMNINGQHDNDAAHEITSPDLTYSQPEASSNHEQHLPRVSHPTDSHQDSDADTSADPDTSQICPEPDQASVAEDAADPDKKHAEGQQPTSQPGHASGQAYVDPPTAQNQAQPEPDKGSTLPEFSLDAQANAAGTNLDEPSGRSDDKHDNSSQAATPLLANDIPAASETDAMDATGGPTQPDATTDQEARPATAESQVLNQLQQGASSSGRLATDCDEGQMHNSGSDRDSQTSCQSVDFGSGLLQGSMATASIIFKNDSTVGADVICWLETLGAAEEPTPLLPPARPQPHVCGSILQASPPPPPPPPPFHPHTQTRARFQLHCVVA